MEATATTGKLNFSVYDDGYYVDTATERFTIQDLNSEYRAEEDRTPGFLLCYDHQELGTFDTLVAAIDAAELRAQAQEVTLAPVKRLYPDYELVGVLSFWAPDGYGWRAVTPEIVGRLVPEGVVEYLAERYRAKTVQLLLEHKADREQQKKADYGIKEIYK